MREIARIELNNASAYEQLIISYAKSFAAVSISK